MMPTKQDIELVNLATKDLAASLFWTGNKWLPIQPGVAGLVCKVKGKVISTAVRFSTAVVLPDTDN